MLRPLWETVAVRQYAGCLIPMVLAIGVAVWFGYDRISTAKRKSAERELERIAQARTRTEIESVAKKHNARLDWVDRFRDDRGFVQIRYTIDLQDALIGEPAQPVVIFGELVDIARKPEGIVVRLRMSFSILDPEVIFTLECSQAVASVLQDAPKQVQLHRWAVSHNSRFAMVASITTLRRPFELQESGDGYDGAEIMLDAGAWIATGQCLEAVPIGGFEWPLPEEPHHE